MTARIHEITVPQLGVNDDSATLIDWYVDEGDRIEAGEVLCALETTKSAFEIDSYEGGIVLHLARIGEEVRIGSPVALIGDTLEELVAERDRRSRQKPASDQVRATKKAERLAKQLGVDLSAVESEGIIREDDVLRHHGGAQTTGSPDSIRPPDPGDPGFVDPEFLSLIEQDPGFARLGSELKIRLYREHGAHIEEGVKIGDGSILLCRVLKLSHDASIGADCRIQADRFEMGRMSVFGNKTRISTREVIVGDVLYTGDEVLIGGGGAWGPRSALHMGDNCLISSRCILNTGEPITIGNEVGLSPGVQIFTHNHWQSVLEGYNARHAPIVLEDKVYLTGGCLIAPGVTVGHGSTVLANSLVAQDIAPLTIAAGVPAKTVGRTQTDLSHEQKHRIIERLMPGLRDHLEHMGINPAHVVYAEKYDQKHSGDALVVLTLEAGRIASDHASPILFDLEVLQVHGEQNRLSDEVRNFLRRRGIRFSPIHWRYTHDEGRVAQ